MVAATGDWTRNTPSEEYPAIRHIYELYDRAADLEMKQFDAPHNYNRDSREAVYQFFGTRILHETDERKLKEPRIQVEKLQDMLALHNRTLPATALTYDGLFQQWKDAARRQFEAGASELRERLAYSLGAEWPDNVVSEGGSDRIVLSRVGKGDRIPGIWIEGGRDLALVVHPGGAAQARGSTIVRQLMEAKSSVLMIDAFQTGAAVAPRNRSAEYFLTFNRTDDANRVQDILTALKFLSQKRSGRLQLIGLDKAAVWALFAAALSPVDLRLTADLGAFQGRDEDFIDGFFVPGIQRAGGLGAARKLADRFR